MKGVWGWQFPPASSVTDTFAFVGGVQPKGTASVTDEPVRKGPVGVLVNVKTKELPGEPATAVVGDTVIVPEPVGAGVTTVRVDVAVAVAVVMRQPMKLKYSVAVNVTVPPVEPAVTEAPVNVTMPFAGTVTQLVDGALKVEPDGAVPVNVTKSPEVRPTTVIGLKVAGPPGAMG